MPSIGISLGDDCIVEAGCCVTAGSRILLEDGRVVKAKELSGEKGLLFRRNSQSGALESKQARKNLGRPQRAASRVEHDPEKCAAVFRKDHAQTIT